MRSLFEDEEQANEEATKEMTIIHSTEILQKDNKRGTLQFWQGHVLQDGLKYYTQTTSWQNTQTGEKSKVKYSDLTLIEKKNVGRANETSLKEQALFEIDSTYKGQKDKGYYLESEGPSHVILPMLAEHYLEHAEKIEFPVYLQGKADGHRALYDGKNFWTRKGKIYVPECVAHLQFDTQGYMFDGEIYLPQPYVFEDSTSAIKKFDPEVTPQLIFRVFDMVDEQLPFSYRLEFVIKIIGKVNETNSNIKTMWTKKVNSHEEILKEHEEFVRRGWEGTIVRLNNAGYEINTRTTQLLKYKDFLDEEFEVVDVEAGKGKHAKIGTLVCKTKEGKLFKATPVGEQEHREGILNNKQEVIGTIWTVRFQEYTKKGIPKFPRALRQRDDLD